jgi:hypothetical protein
VADSLADPAPVASQLVDSVGNSFAEFGIHEIVYAHRFGRAPGRRTRKLGTSPCSISRTAFRTVMGDMPIARATI